MKRIGIVAHSAEGGSLCFITVCREGQKIMGEHMHPEIIVSAVPMALSLDGWENGDHETVAGFLRKGVEQVAAAGADFFICPDNTAHIILEKIIDTYPSPGLHIADVVINEMKKRNFKSAGLLGTKWTMTGPVYEAALKRKGFERHIPDEQTRAEINTKIFDELCQGIFEPKTTEIFVNAIEVLKRKGADFAILGCTEIPIIINDKNSPLPVLDTTRLLAEHAV
ncbi:MAG: amino acid racemase, partial [Melioribacteraceae bacterium]